MTANEILHTPFKNRSVLGRLYEAWHRLPACPMLAVVGDAIQEIQAYEAIIMKTQADVERNLQRVLSALKEIREVELGGDDVPAELRELRFGLEINAGRLAKLLAKRLAGNVQERTDDAHEKE